MYGRIDSLPSYRHRNRPNRQQLNILKQIRLRHLLESLVKHILGVLLGVMVVDPILAGEGNTLRVLGDFLPVSLVPPVACGLACFLDRPDALVSAQD
jgi:hypothetical protein